MSVDIARSSTGRQIMKKVLLSTTFFILGSSIAVAGSNVLYNESLGTVPTFVSPQNSDVTGSIPLVTKSGVINAPNSFAAPNWTGPYVGVNVGAGWANTQLGVPGVASFSGVGMYGVTGGLTGGFDYQFTERMVAGLAIDGNVNSTNAAGSITGLGNAEFREAASWALRGRVGVLTSEETMIYATAGVSEAFTDLSFPNTPGVGGGGGARYVGPVFGAGIETHLTGNLYAHAEYIHGVYDKRWFGGGSFEAEPTTGLARVGLIYRPMSSAGGPNGERSMPLRESWTGAYVGIQGGWGWNSTSLSSPNAFSANGIGGSGPVGGLLVGYDYQIDQSVAGLEMDASAAGVKSSLAILPVSGQINYDWDYSIRGRFGRVFCNTLLFGTAGWAQTHGQLTTVGLGGITANHLFTGFQFGGGLETMLTAHVGARLEYLQSFYDKYASVLGSSIDATPTAGKARAAVVYKF